MTAQAAIDRLEYDLERAISMQPSNHGSFAGGVTVGLKKSLAWLRQYKREEREQQEEEKDG